MTANISTLRPGLLVSLKTSIRGNVEYASRDLEVEHETDAGTTRARWETERTITNKAELERAIKARTAARSAITGVCAQSVFGLLCPESWEKSLQEGIARARQIAAEFNARASVTELAVYVIVGRVAQNDVEAVRAINSEVRSLMREMTAGLRNLDVKQVRDAANRARSVGMMLTPEAGERIKSAIDAAREAARKITKAGEEASKEIDGEAIKQINRARTAFLDLDESSILPTEAPKVQGRAIDLTPEEEAPARRPTKKKGAAAKERAAPLGLDGLSNEALEPAVRTVRAWRAANRRVTDGKRQRSSTGRRGASKEVGR